MKEVTEIPYKNPIRQQLVGRVQEHEEYIEVGEVRLSPLLSRKLQRRCRGYESLQDAVEDKELYVLGRKVQDTVEWFGLVSGEFKAMTPDFLDSHLYAKATERIMRYDESLERVQIGYVLEKQGENRIMMHVDSGDFGIYGGNGESAAQVGVSIAHAEPTMWTLFYMPKDSEQGMRAIHKCSEKSVRVIVKEQLQYATRVQEQWEQAATRAYTAQELMQFTQAYLDGQKRVIESTLQQFSAGALGREFVEGLQAQAAQLIGYSRLRLEERIGGFVQMG